MKPKNYFQCLFTGMMLCSVHTSIFGQSLPPYVPVSGLVAWWPFSGSAADSSINNNNGIVNGATLTTDRFGNPNSAYLFDGTSSYISVPNSPSLKSPQYRLSMSAWVNLSGYSLVGQAFNPILTKNDNGANAFMYRFTIDFVGQGFFAGVNNWNSNTGGFGDTLFSNQWYLLTAVLDSNESRFYLNDSLLGSQVFASNIFQDNYPLEIGRDMPGITEIFNGKIDDIGIWNVALTHQQIKNLYDGTACTPTTSTLNPIACNSYSSPSGNAVWATSGTYTDTLINLAGCDSIITVNLTINTVNDSVSQNGLTLSAYATGATYQWLDCNNGLITIPGAVNQSFTPTVNGSFSVVITQNNCSDTSNCYTITGVGLSEVNYSENIQLFPNPTSANLTIQLSHLFDNCRAEIFNPFGQLLINEPISQIRHSVDVSSLNEGLYLLEIVSPYFKASRKLIIIK